MFKWYKNLYVGNTAKKKEKTIRRKIERRSSVLGVYIITIAANPSNHLEIMSAIQLKQPIIAQRCPMIVGIANGYDEALEVVERIVNDVWKATGSMDIRTWLLDHQER